jgi:hypothetical protein
VEFTYKGFEVSATARKLNQAPNEVWGPQYRINGKDQSSVWTPRDRSVVFATEQSAIQEAKVRAQWLIDNLEKQPSE